MAAFHRILLLLAVAALASVAARRSLRTRRGLLELADAIKCSTGKSPLLYLTYGCYCGLGGKGAPLDDSDRCCFAHDCCYGDAEAKGCEPKTMSYKWSCEDKEFECEDLEDKCEERLCKCDKAVAECLGKAQFHPTDIFWKKCDTAQPTCGRD